MPNRRRLRLRGAVALVILVAGCGERARPPRSHLTDTPLAPLIAPHTPKAPASRRFRFRATDGVRLSGRFYPARRRRAAVVVLVHGLAGNPRQWDGFAHDLHRAGFAALAYASRSNEQTDQRVLERDLVGAIRALRRRVRPRRIELAGASVGGSVVARVLSDAPGLARRGVAFSEVGVPRDPPPHDLLLITDARERAAVPGVTVVTAGTAGHGSALLRDPRARAQAVAWLSRR